MFKRLFGKKNDGFYLQLEDDSNTPKAPAQAKSQPPATEKVTKAVTEPSAASVEAVKPTATPVAPTTTDKADVKTESTPVAPATAKADVKADKKARKKAESAKKVEAPKAPVVAAPPAPAPVVTNFATDYLIKPSSASGRRRPGANMNMFLDMARQAKKPANIK